MGVESITKLEQQIVKAALLTERYYARYQKLQSKMPSYNDKTSPEELNALQKDRNQASDSFVSYFGILRKLCRKLRQERL